MPKGFPLQFIGLPNYDNLKKEIEEKLNDPNKGPSWIESAKTGEVEGYVEIKINKFTVKVYHATIHVNLEIMQMWFECTYDCYTKNNTPSG